MSDMMSADISTAVDFPMNGSNSNNPHGMSTSQEENVSPDGSQYWSMVSNSIAGSLPRIRRKGNVLAGDQKNDETETTSSEKMCSQDVQDDDNEITAEEIERIQVIPDIHSSNSEAEEVVMSVFWTRGMLGAASYDVETSEINLLTDIVDVNPEFNMLRSLFHQVQPTHVVTSGGLSENFIKTLRELVSNGESDDDSVAIEPSDYVNQTNLHILPKKDYMFESCKRRVYSLHLPSEPEGSNDEEHQLFISSLVAMTAESMVHAFGALLKWLDKSWAHLNLDPLSASSAAPVRQVNTLSLEDVVTIDAESYEALQIFSQQSHPSNFKMWSPGSSKEGLSVFGILNRCKSRLGCKFMRVMLLHPTRNIETLNARLDVVEFCMQPKNEDMVKNLLDSLKSIKSVTLMIKKLSAAKASVAEWKTLHKTLYHSILIGELCATIADKAPLFKEIAESLSDNLQHVAACINQVVDFTESENQNKFIVRLGIDEELDNLKMKLGCLTEIMNSIAVQELAGLPPDIHECTVVYIPEIGYLLAIPNASPDLRIPGLEYMFMVNSTIHFKSARCRELDATVGDGFTQVSGQEGKIMIKLIQFVEEHLPSLVKIVKLSAELDGLIAFAAVAREHNYVRPTLTTDGIIKIVGGRHPLQELCVDDFVPNDTISGGTDGRMKILTGPNASGKSVYLKQVALIAYLAHIGSFVPAESASIGILDHIHTRIQTIESIATRLSAFMIDMRQMSLSLFCSTPSSLIIIDEFGKGTSEVDGLALLASSLKSFLDRGEHCPHVFVSTHFHHVTEFIPASPYLQSQTLTHLVDNDGRIVYLYKLKEGQAKSSFALKVAEMVGIPESLINRAGAALKALQSGEPMEKLLTCKRNLQLIKYMDCHEKLMAVSNESEFGILKKCLKEL